MHTTPLPPWWNPEAVRTLLDDLIGMELKQLFHPRAGLPGALPGAAALAPETRLDGPDGLALSSLDLLDLATTVAVQLGVHDADLETRLLARPTLQDWTEAVLAARAQDDSLIGFRTSGTTGTPKLRIHRMDTLEQEIAVWAGLLEDRRRVLRAVPCHHIYGFLFGLMLPSRLGVPVVDIRGELPVGALRRAQPGDLLVGHPAFFELAARGGGTTAPDLVAVTSTSPCPDDLWADLAGAGVERLLEIYGSTETGGVGRREAAAAPFELLPFWSPLPDDPSAVLRRLPDGAETRVGLQDRLDWCGPRRFRVAGRVDGSIQVGGTNVFPDRVRAVLLAHPEVAAAEVHPGGHGVRLRLAASVTPVTAPADPHTWLAALDTWLAARLSAPERPRPLTLSAAAAAIDDPLDSKS